MNFDHPADAMRAKINDELACINCKHILPANGAWCKQQPYAPNNSASGFLGGHCHKFKYSHGQFHKL